MVWDSGATIQQKKETLLKAGFEAVIADHDLTMMLLVVCRELYGYGPETCKKELYRYFNDLTNTKKMAKVESKYKLKEGQLLYSNGQHYSNANLTDEIAEALLKNTPALINAFEVIPKEEVKLPDPEPVKEPEIKKVPEPTKEPVKKPVRKKPTKR